MSSKALTCGNINIAVYIIIILFGIGSWIDINGLWVELPLMITEGALPEQWKLLSYLSVIIQIANIGPLFVTLMHTCAPGKLKEKTVIYSILGIGSVACFLLAFFWDKTSYFAGEDRSTALLVLQFFLALVDCTTSVVFLPFMVIFKPQYMTAYFIGEGMSGFLPGIVALGQGVGSVSCHNISYTNSTTNHTSFQIEPRFAPPNFPVEDFFFFLFAMVLTSGIAFTLLNHLPICKQEYAKGEEIEEEDDKFRTSYELVNGHNSDEVSVFSDPVSAGSSTSKLVRSSRKKQKLEINISTEIATNVPSISGIKYAYYLFITAILNGLANGVLPSIQTYSCLPYGTKAYHITAALFNIANPTACFIVFFLPTSSALLLSTLSVLGTATAGFILYTAAASPTPLLVGTTNGQILIVLVWVIGGLLLTYSKVMIATLFRTEGHRALLWIGVMQQIGSLIGSIIMFVLVNEFNLFQMAPYCPS